MICQNCFNEIPDDQPCSICGFEQNHNRNEKCLALFTVLNGRYLLGRVLGIGGFGITYLALDIQTNTRVAIKECFPDSNARRSQASVVPAQNCAEQFNESKQLFLREVGILKRIRGLYGLVNILDSFSENNTEYYVMEYIQGVSLKYLVSKSGGRLSKENSLYVLFEIGNLLINLHNKKIVHRDISPENIMVTPEGQLILIDFGTAIDYINPPKENAVFLKHGFAPPEQYQRNGPVGPFVDVYALGAMFYTISTGRPLIDARNRKEFDTLKPLNQLDEYRDSNEISRFIERAMALDYNTRYYSVENLFEDAICSIVQAEGFSNSLLQLVESYIPRGVRTNGEISLQNRYEAFVEVISGRNKGKVVRIPDYGFAVVGRDPAECDLVIDDNINISRIHCLVGYDEHRHRFVIIDRSRHGTLFNNGTYMISNYESYIAAEEIFCLYDQKIKLRVSVK